jgi:LacI family transcriptional regulator
MIGMVLPRSVASFFADPYFPSLTQGIAQACNQNDYTLALFLVGTKEDDEKIFSRVSRNGLLDGVLVQSSVTRDNLIDRLAKTNVPMVVLGRPPHMSDVSYIDVDNVMAAYNAVNHLIELGRRRIGTIAGPQDTTVGLDRKEGYVKALVDRGLGTDKHLIEEGDFTEEGGYLAMQRLIPAGPDAVFVASDMMAIGAIRAVRQIGLRVPQDIAFVGFDDLPIARMADPQLTTMQQPVQQSGVRAVEMLIDLIENTEQPVRRVIMDAKLIVRDSSDASRRE